jgi:hypothetical protein
MAILLYPNGLIETIKPKDLVFSEAEIVDLFNEYELIKTCRLIPILNTWCVYGSNKDDTGLDYNQIASSLTREDIYFHALFIHDSEIDPDWKITDMLYDGYDKFEATIRKIINDIANDIVDRMNEETPELQDTKALPQLITLGTSKDKKIIFGFDLKDQHPDFTDGDKYYEFAKNVYKYISSHKQNKEPFVIYSDKASVVVVEPDKVDEFLTSIRESFMYKEEYETCKNITSIMQEWKDRNSSKKPKKQRKPRTPKKTDEQ